MNDDFENLLGRLVASKAEFVVIGGFAATLHGVSLVTEDIDVCCRFTRENLYRLQAALADLHPVHRLTPQKMPLDLDAQYSLELRNLYLRTDFGVLDCLGDVAGIGGFDAVHAQSVEFEFPFGRCRVIGIDGLIRAKEALHRSRDLRAVVLLRAIKEKTEKPNE